MLSKIEVIKITLTFKNFTKAYSKFTAIKNFSYDFTPGVYGQGFNGVLKYTLMNIITDNLESILGESFWQKLVNLQDNVLKRLDGFNLALYSDKQNISKTSSINNDIMAFYVQQKKLKINQYII